MEKGMQEAMDYIKTISELGEEEKNQFIAMIQNGENPLEVLDKVEDKLQDKLDDVFKGEGIELDENDPEYQAKNKEMTDEIKAAEDEFDKTMDDIQKESDQIQEETLREADDIKAQALKDQLTS
jgi:hypothetical protein